MKKQRLDELLIGGGLAADIKEAFVMVTEGRVWIGGQKAVSPSQLVADGSLVDVRKNRRFVGRAAYKLEAALKGFEVKVNEKVCLDAGSAVGGFVSVLLDAGAKKVYAVDTASGELDSRLLEDKRVVLMEETNVLHMEPLKEKVDFVSVDVSWTSLRLILPVLRKFLKDESDIILLFKPQYEVRDHRILKNGIVKDEKAREALLENFLRWAAEEGWKIRGKMESPVRGAKGKNIEYLIHLGLSASAENHGLGRG